MESLTPKSHRTPLKQLNSPAPQSQSAVPANAKRKPAPASTGKTKEGWKVEEVKMMAVEVSLADELSAVRRRRERVKAERERTEKVLREMDLVLEREMEEMERRWVEQKKVEDDLKQIVASIKDPILELELRFLLNGAFFPVRSLREMEKKARTPSREAAAAAALLGSEKPEMIFFLIGVSVRQCSRNHRCVVNCDLVLTENQAWRKQHQGGGRSEEELKKKIDQS